MKTFIPQEIIRKKRDGKVLSQEEIHYFVRSVVDGTFMDSQISSFAMAIYFQGLSHRECALLTNEMCQSGEVCQWPMLDGPVVDKHSTGGVGDKVSLILGPLLAACGVYVPMLAGRGLGHTGGTIDKLESIPGYNVFPGLEQFRDVVADVGCAIIGQTKDIAPADRRFYAVRDVTSTVESRELITASILSKKFAEGLDGLVMDVKYGNGAFASTFSDAQKLSQSLRMVAGEAGLKITSLLTDMNQILGSTVGNALEVVESIEMLKTGKGNPRLLEITYRLCEEALILTGVCSSHNEARNKLVQAMRSGLAFEKFEKMIVCLGGPKDFVAKIDAYLPLASYIMPVYPIESGYILSMDTRHIGLSLIELGGGRLNNADKIDFSVGFSSFANIGEYVDAHNPIAYIHARNEKDFKNAAESILKHCHIGDEKLQLDSSLLVYADNDVVA